MAKQYNQQALPILTEINDHYGQANIYSNLGWIAQEQQQLDQARDYFLQALEIFTAYEDVEAASPALFGLALLWQKSCDLNLLSDIASILPKLIVDLTVKPVDQHRAYLYCSD